MYPFALGAGTLSAANYDFPATGLIGNTLTVTPAALTITANAETKVYGAAVPAVTYEVSGLVNNDTPSVVSGAAQHNDVWVGFDRSRHVPLRPRSGNAIGR